MAKLELVRKIPWRIALIVVSTVAVAVVATVGIAVSQGCDVVVTMSGVDVQCREAAPPRDRPRGRRGTLEQ